MDVEIRISPQERRVIAALFRRDNGNRQQTAAINTVAANEIIELAVPLNCWESSRMMSSSYL